MLNCVSCQPLAQQLFTSVFWDWKPIVEFGPAYRKITRNWQFNSVIPLNALAVTPYTVHSAFVRRFQTLRLCPVSSFPLFRLSASLPDAFCPSLLELFHLLDCAPLCRRGPPSSKCFLRFESTLSPFGHCFSLLVPFQSCNLPGFSVDLHLIYEQ